MCWCPARSRWRPREMNCWRIPTSAACSWAAEPRKRSVLAEGRYPRLCASEYQGVDVVRALICVDGFQIHHMADDVKLVGNAVAAVHVACDACDVQRFAAGIALEQRNH